MSTLFVLLLLALHPLPVQGTPTPSQNNVLTSGTAYKQLDRLNALQSRARQILKSELSRRIDHECGDANLSNAESGKCLNADAAITERNHRLFTRALEASLTIEPPDVAVSGLPLPSRNFTAAEAAWHSYVGKTCAALGDTEYGASGTPTDMVRCQQYLTRQHMKDLGELFLNH
ncbi:MAG TPA: hypothetical protein VGM11_11920 [Acidobacteriaceae bacterium]|jgi:hypothetical protein